MTETIIFRDVPLDDFSTAVRAARWLVEHPKQREAILCYGSGTTTYKIDFYVKRNKSSITVRKIGEHDP